MEEKLLNEVEERDAIDMLLDDECTDDITLYDENNNPVDFEQIAVIPYNEKVYCVLRPLDKIPGIKDDEAVVFYVDERPTGSVLMVEQNEKTAIAVFDEYYNLLEKESKPTKPSKK